MKSTVAGRFRAIRAVMERLCAPLQVEDTAIQTMPDVSPTKWHLAHATWFFEAFVLRPFADGYRPFHPRFHYLFNSYYQTVGEMHPRAQRGLLSRPTLAEILEYRRAVDAAIADLLAGGGGADLAEVVRRIELGLHHEQQHQELLLMDAKHVLGSNPLCPPYREDLCTGSVAAPRSEWVQLEGGMAEIGADPERGFCFDNETPRHPVLVQPFQLASRPVTNAEWREFVADGGYRRSELWLADGWTRVGAEGWRCPLYWHLDERDAFAEYTLGGLRPLEDDAPVVHVSYYEADAFARWAGARLPSEQEWEVAGARVGEDGNFAESDRLHPAASGPAPEGVPAQMFGDVWEWTSSAYQPYPGFRPLPGSLGEYNGKFMCSQQVLRGGCCATPREHVRATYRNFFYPHQRWAFSGLRLARDVR